MTNSDKYNYFNHSYILHSYAYQESSIIANVLTFEQGRVNVLAKGVKSSKKGLASLLKPFQSLSLSYLRKDELSILTGTEKSSQLFAKSSNKVCTGNALSEKAISGKALSGKALSGKALYCAYYLNELLLRLLPLQEPCEEIFLLYEETIAELNFSEDRERILRSFEVKLLFFLGYELNLEFDAFSHQPIEKNKYYYYDPLSGPYEIEKQNVMVKDQHTINHPQVAGKSLIALNALDFSDKSVVKECKNLLRLVLQQYLGNTPLKSRELYQQLYGMQDKK